MLSTMTKQNLLSLLLKSGKSKEKKKDKQKPDVTCENCNRPGHSPKVVEKNGKGQDRKRKAKRMRQWL
jgi:protein-arginine kinase activator protein McsA